MNSSEPAHDQLDDSSIDAVGLVAFSLLAVMTRLAKDGDQVETIEAHIEHARMSARSFDYFSRLEKWAKNRGINLPEAAGRYNGLFDDLDARTRPRTWWERSVKTYIMVGMLGDFLHEIVDQHNLFSFDQDTCGLGQIEWEQAHLAIHTKGDPQLAARLSLWARRVAGEVLALVRSTLFTHPTLAQSPEYADQIAAFVRERHGKRMEAINLQP